MGLVMLLVGAVALGGTVPQAGQAARARTLAIGEFEPVTTLDPLAPKTGADRRLHELIYDRLFRLDGDGRTIVSDVVEPGWRAMDEGVVQELVLTPRAGIRWHDGSELTAGDLCHTVERVLRRPASWPSAARVLSGCAVEGERAVLTLSRGLADPEKRLMVPVVPLPAGRTPEALPVGTGVYRLIEAHMSERGPARIRLDAFDQPGRTPAIRRIAVHAGGDPFVVVRAARRGENDVLVALDQAFYGELTAGSGGWRMRQGLHRSVGGLWFDPGARLASDPKRRALIAAVVAQAWSVPDMLQFEIPDAPERTGQLASGPYPRGSVFLDETIKVDAVWMHPPHSDARRAEVAVRRRALATPLEGSIAVTDQIAGLSMQPVAWLRAAFSDRDLEVEVGHASGCCAIDAPDALAVRMDVGWDDDLSRWAHSTGDRNLWGVQDPVADRLVDAMHTGPREDQVRAGRALHRHLMESGRFMPLWHVDQKVWISPRLPPDVPIVPRDAWTLIHTWTWATP